MSSKRSTGDVLLELMDKVPDAKKLETLLDPMNLVRLTLAYGFDTAQVRRELQGGKLPGEVLLDLLAREPDADKLLARLDSAPAVPQPSGGGRRAGGPLSGIGQQIEAARAQSRAYYNGPDTPQQRTRIRMLGLLFIIVGVVLTAMMVAWLGSSTGRVFKLEVALLVMGPVLVILGLYTVLTGHMPIRS